MARSFLAMRDLGRVAHLAPALSAGGVPHEVIEVHRQPLSGGFEAGQGRAWRRRNSACYGTVAAGGSAHITDECGFCRYQDQVALTMEARPLCRVGLHPLRLASAVHRVAHPPRRLAPPASRTPVDRVRHC